MSQYWSNDGKIGVKQTQVSVPSTNGRSYSATAGSGGPRMDFEIPPSVKFLDGKNSYLQFDIKISAGAIPTRLTLDPFIGGQSLVKNLRISSKNGTLLEEISDYNCKVQIQYSYDTDDSIKKMRALREGSLVPCVRTRGTQGTSVSNNTDLMSNPYFKPKLVNVADANWGVTDFVTAKLSLPIHSGVFADSSKIFPVLMTQGILVSVDLEDPARVIKQLDSVNRNRRMGQNPIFHGIDAAGGTLTQAATERTEIFLGKQNGVLTVADCPFVVGERVALCVKDNPLQQCNLTIGQAAVTPSGVLIKNIDVSGGFVRLTTEGFRNSAAAAGQGAGLAAATNAFIVYSTSVDTARVTSDTGVQFIAPLTLYDAGYVISDAEMVCAKVECDPRYEEGMVCKMREGGSIELDIMSCTNIKHSLLATNRQATVNLACSNTRVKSTIIMPTDASVYNTAELIGGLSTTYDIETTVGMDDRLHSIRSGQTGIIDQLTDFQMLVDQKLVPSRPIVVSKINKGVSIAAQPLIELEKALIQAGIQPRSFAEYNRNFLIGRAYSLDDGVANLNNVSNQLQLQYNESSVAGVDRPPVKNKLLMAFIFHLRRITIKGDSLTVTL